MKEISIFDLDAMACKLGVVLSCKVVFLSKVMPTLIRFEISRANSIFSLNAVMLGAIWLAFNVMLW